MSQQQTIKFSIKQDGTITEEVIGVVGTECEQLTKIIEEKLGEVTLRLNKPEYYQTTTIQEDVALQHNQNED